MPKQEIVEVLLEADENVISAKQISQRLAEDVGKDRVVRDMRKIVSDIGVDYDEWAHNTASYRPEEVRMYEQRLRETYGLTETPESVKQELRELGLMD
ncbi:MAG: hypothetical protein ABEJ98_02410 [Candidatus Nanohaloarchaea archaeon]